jgi:hypothetical protein
MTLPISTARRALLSALAGIGAAGALSRANGAVPAANAAAANAGNRSSDPVHDFDEFFGNWHVRHRRLKDRLAGSTAWIEFEGSQTMWPILGGAGNMTDNVFNLPGGVVQRGVTLRAFDRKTQKWSIWWLDGNEPTKLDVPVIGGFERGTGAFYADDSFKGKPIKVRFLWKNITHDTRQWEQAFSPDAGKTWETNWIAWFTRQAGPDVV